MLKQTTCLLGPLERILVILTAITRTAENLDICYPVRASARERDDMISVVSIHQTTIANRIGASALLLLEKGRNLIASVMTLSALLAGFVIALVGANFVRVSGGVGGHFIQNNFALFAIMFATLLEGFWLGSIPAKNGISLFPIVRHPFSGLGIHMILVFVRPSIPSNANALDAFPITNGAF